MATVWKEQVLVGSRAVVARVVAGETLIVPIRGKVGDLASIYGFSGTGSLIWNCWSRRGPESEQGLPRISCEEIQKRHNR